MTDLSRFLVGEITEVSGLLKTFIKERPMPDNKEQMGEVDVDDAALSLAKFHSGAIGSIEGTRFATGRKNYNRFEINGSKGSIAFNMERMNELEYYNAEDPADVRGFRVIQTTDSVHPYTGNYWPVGHIIGYEHTFINFFRDVLDDFAAGRPTHPDFYEGLQVNKVLDAVTRSSETRTWQSV